MTEKDTMQLKSLHLHRGYDEETFTVSATFEGTQKVELSLGPEIGRKILELCASEIIAAVTSAVDVAMVRFKGDMAKELPPPSDPDLVPFVEEDGKEEIPF